MGIVKLAIKMIRSLIAFTLGLIFLCAFLSVWADIHRSPSEIGQDELEDMRIESTEHPFYPTAEPESKYRQSIDDGLYSLKFWLEKWAIDVKKETKKEGINDAILAGMFARQLKAIQPTNRYTLYDFHIDLACDDVIEFARLYREGAEQNNKVKIEQSIHALSMFALKMHDAEREKERIGWN